MIIYYNRIKGHEIPIPIIPQTAALPFSSSINSGLCAAPWATLQKQQRERPLEDFQRARQGVEKNWVRFFFGLTTTMLDLLPSQAATRFWVRSRSMALLNVKKTRPKNRYNRPVGKLRRTKKPFRLEAAFLSVVRWVVRKGQGEGSGREIVTFCIPPFPMCFLKIVHQLLAMALVDDVGWWWCVPL